MDYLKLRRKLKLLFWKSALYAFLFYLFLQITHMHMTEVCLQVLDLNFLTHHKQCTPLSASISRCHTYCTLKIFPLPVVGEWDA